MARIAFVLAQDFEDSEFSRPFQALQEAGHELTIVGIKANQQVRGKRGEASTLTQVAASDVTAEDFDALVIPGGYSPDRLRTDKNVVEFVRSMVDAQKPVAAICHAASLLIEANAVAGRTLTSWPSVRKDVENAGGRWVDRRVVEDGNLITSRKPDDLDAFCASLLQRLERVGTTG